MAATPVLFAVSERFLIPRLEAEPVPDYDTIEAADAPVIICGFGRFGQIVGRVLRMHGIRFTALERDLGQVDVVRRFGNKVYFGDPQAGGSAAVGGGGAGETADRRAGPHGGRAAGRGSRQADLSRTEDFRAGAQPAARASADGPGVDGLVRETFFSSLKMAEDALLALGIAAEDAARSVALFREHDEQNLVDTHAIYRDEKQLIQSVQQSTEELSALFEADQKG